MATTLSLGDCGRVKAWQTIYAAVAALLLSACGPALTDAQRLWCGDSGHMAYVIEASEGLGIPVPEPIYSNYLIVNGFEEGEYVPDDDAVVGWEGGSNYARACIAAFDSR